MLILIKVPELSISLYDKTFLPPHPPHRRGSAEEHCSWGNPNIPLFSWSFTGATTLSKSQPHSPQDTRGAECPSERQETHGSQPLCRRCPVSVAAGRTCGHCLTAAALPRGLPGWPLLTISASVKQLYSSQCSGHRAADSPLEQKRLHFPHLQAKNLFDVMTI